MKSVVLSLFVFTAACGSAVNSPTSPTGSSAALVTAAPPAGDLPFQGSFTGQSSSVVNCPTTCPPTILTISGNETGTATHLGRFSAESVEVVDIATATGTGTITFTAADGARLFTTTAGGEVGFTPPNTSQVRSVATITGGTGRLAGASGTIIVEFTQVIDFANATATMSGNLQGHINLRP